LIEWGIDMEATAKTKQALLVINLRK